MKKMLIVLILVAPTNALAEFYDGNELMEYITEQNQRGRISGGCLCGEGFHYDC